MDARLKNADDLKKLIADIGFIPLFHAEGTEMLSVEALTYGQWWTGLKDDPWLWRETLSEDHDILYGKFFSGRAGFIHKEWLPTFANCRRDGYDFDSRADEGLAPQKHLGIIGIVKREGRILSSELKRETGVKGYEGAITLLQMQTYLMIDGFGRRIDKNGRPYGWSIAYLSEPETRYGYDFVTSLYTESTEISLKRILTRAKDVCPQADEDMLLTLFAGR